MKCNGKVADAPNLVEYHTIKSALLWNEPRLIMIPIIKIRHVILIGDGKLTPAIHTHTLAYTRWVCDVVGVANESHTISVSGLISLHKIWKLWLYNWIFGFLWLDFEWKITNSVAGDSAANIRIICWTVVYSANSFIARTAPKNNTHVIIVCGCSVCFFVSLCRWNAVENFNIASQNENHQIVIISVWTI